MLNFARMRNLFVLLLIAILLTACNNGNDNKMSALYGEIDSVIAANEHNVNTREADIASLKRKWSVADGRQKYDYADSIYERYSSYINDSAVAWALRSGMAAKAVGDSVAVAKSTLNLVAQYAKTGYYTEAAGYFNSLHVESLPDDLRPIYYNVGSDLYGNSGYSADDPFTKQKYWKRSEELRDSLYAIVPHNSALYFRNRVQELVNDKKAGEALKVSDLWAKTVGQGTHDFAIMAYYRSEAYRIGGDTLSQKEWLAKSAIADISNTVMDQASLWMLADIIYREGDIDRAYRYMDFSWQCVSRFSAHKRAWDVTPILTVIDKSFQQKTQSANRRLTVLIVLIVLFSLTVLGMLIYVQKKRHELGEAQEALAESNRQLRATIEKLHKTNAELHESDRVKDKYIGQFFSMCSSYIEKLSSFRAKVRRKLKAGQKKELMEMTDPDVTQAEEHKALMNNFDDIFLSLYPSFVDEFNALLKPGCSVRPTGKERMNATLRIFALIRLGITESSRIAEILGYSPNSIYNYRTRAKNMAACPRDEFEERVKAVKVL